MAPQVHCDAVLDLGEVDGELLSQMQRKCKCKCKCNVCDKWMRRDVRYDVVFMAW